MDTGSVSFAYKIPYVESVIIIDGAEIPMDFIEYLELNKEVDYYINYGNYIENGKITPTKETNHYEFPMNKLEYNPDIELVTIKVNILDGDEEDVTVRVYPLQLTEILTGVSASLIPVIEITNGSVLVPENGIWIVMIDIKDKATISNEIQTAGEDVEIDISTGTSPNTKPPVETVKNTLQVNTNPAGAKIELKIKGSWVVSANGFFDSLETIIYDIRVSASSHKTTETKVKILKGKNVEYIELVPDAPIIEETDFPQPPENTPNIYENSLILGKDSDLTNISSLSSFGYNTAINGVVVDKYISNKKVKNKIPLICNFNSNVKDTTLVCGASKFIAGVEWSDTGGVVTPIYIDSSNIPYNYIYDETQNVLISDNKLTSISLIEKTKIIADKNIVIPGCTIESVVCEQYTMNGTVNIIPGNGEFFVPKTPSTIFITYKLKNSSGVEFEVSGPINTPHTVITKDILNVSINNDFVYVEFDVPSAAFAELYDGFTVCSVVTTDSARNGHPINSEILKNTHGISRPIINVKDKKIGFCVKKDTSFEYMIAVSNVSGGIKYMLHGNCNGASSHMAKFSIPTTNVVNLAQNKSLGEPNELDEKSRKAVVHWVCDGGPLILGASIEYSIGMKKYISDGALLCTDGALLGGMKLPYIEPNVGVNIDTIKAVGTETKMYFGDYLYTGIFSPMGNISSLYSSDTVDRFNTGHTTVFHSPIFENKNNIYNETCNISLNMDSDCEIYLFDPTIFARTSHLSLTDDSNRISVEIHSKIKKFKKQMDVNVQKNSTVYVSITKHGYLQKILTININDADINLNTFNGVTNLVPITALDFSGYTNSLKNTKNSVDVTLSAPASNPKIKSIVPYVAGVTRIGDREFTTINDTNKITMACYPSNADGTAINVDTYYEGMIRDLDGGARISLNDIIGNVPSKLTIKPTGGNGTGKTLKIYHGNDSSIISSVSLDKESTINVFPFINETFIELYDNDILIYKAPLYIGSKKQELVVKIPTGQRNKLSIIPIKNKTALIMWEEKDHFIAPYYSTTPLNKFTKVTKAEFGESNFEYIYGVSTISATICINGYYPYNTTISTVGEFDLNSIFDKLVPHNLMRYYEHEMFARHYSIIENIDLGGTRISDLPVLSQCSGNIDIRKVKYNCPNMFEYSLNTTIAEIGSLRDNVINHNEANMYMHHGNIKSDPGRKYIERLRNKIEILFYINRRGISQGHTIAGMQRMSGGYDWDTDVVIPGLITSEVFDNTGDNIVYFRDFGPLPSTPNAYTIIPYSNNMEHRILFEYGKTSKEVMLETIDTYNDAQGKIKYGNERLLLFNVLALYEYNRPTKWEPGVIVPVHLKPDYYMSKANDNGITLINTNPGNGQSSLVVGNITLDNNSAVETVVDSDMVSEKPFYIDKSGYRVLTSVGDKKNIYYKLPSKDSVFVQVAKYGRYGMIGEDMYTLGDIIIFNSEDFGVGHDKNIKSPYTNISNTTTSGKGYYENITISSLPGRITGQMTLFAGDEHLTAEFYMDVTPEDIVNGILSIPVADLKITTSRVTTLADRQRIYSKSEVSSGMYIPEYKLRDSNTWYTLNDYSIIDDDDDDKYNIRYRDRVTNGVMYGDTYNLRRLKYVINVSPTDPDLIELYGVPNTKYYNDRKAVLHITQDDPDAVVIQVKGMAQTFDSLLFDSWNFVKDGKIDLYFGAYIIQITRKENGHKTLIPIIIDTASVTINIDNIDVFEPTEVKYGTLTINLENDDLSFRDVDFKIYRTNGVTTVSTATNQRVNTGSHVLQAISNGYVTGLYNITIIENQNTKVDVLLEKIPEGEIIQDIMVTLSPYGTKLLMEINGVYIRILPDRKIMLRPGEYKWNASYPSYNPKSGVFVVTPETTKFNFAYEDSDIKKYNVSFRLVEPKHNVKTYIGISDTSGNDKYDLIETSEMIVPHGSIIYVKIEAEGYETDGYYMSIDRDTVIDVNMSRGKGDIRCLNIPIRMFIKFRHVDDSGQDGPYVLAHPINGLASKVKKGKVVMYVEYSESMTPDSFNPIYKEKEIIIDHLNDPTMVDISKYMEDSIMYGEVDISSNISKVELYAEDKFTYNRVYRNLKIGVNKIPIGKYQIVGNALNGEDYLFNQITKEVTIKENEKTSVAINFMKLSDLELELNIKIFASQTTIKKYDKYKWKVEYKENNSNTWVLYKTVEDVDRIAVVELPKKKAGTIWTIRVTDVSADKVYNETIDTVTWHSDNHKEFTMFEQVGIIEVLNPSKFHPRNGISLSYGDKEYEYYYDRFGYDFDEIRKSAHYNSENGTYKYLPSLPYLTLLATHSGTFDICNHIPHFHGTIHGSSIHHNITGSRAVLNISHFDNDLLSKAPRQPMYCNLERFYVPDYEPNGTIYSVTITCTTHQYFDVVAGDITERHGLAHKQTPSTVYLNKRGSHSIRDIYVGTTYSSIIPYSFEIEIVNIKTNKIMYIGKTAPAQIIDFISTNRNKWMQLKGVTFNERRMYKISINGLSLASDEKIYLYSVYDTGEMNEVLGSGSEVRIKSIWKYIDTNYPSNDKLSGFIHTTRYATFMYVKDGHKPIQITIDISSKMRALYKDDYNIRINFSEISAKIEDTVLTKYAEYLVVDFTKTTDVDSFMFYYDINGDDKIINRDNDDDGKVYDVKGLVFPINTLGENGVYSNPRVYVSGAINMIFNMPISNIKSIIGDKFVVSMKNISRLGIANGSTPTNNIMYTDYRIESIGRSYEYKIDVQIREVVNGRVKKYKYEDDTSDGVMFGTYVFSDYSYIIVKFPKGQPIRYFRSPWVKGIVLRYFRDGYTSPVTVIDRVTGIPPSATVEIAMPQMTKLDQI